MPAVRATASGIEVDLWVTPRASQPGLGPLRGDRLRAAVSAPPVDGEANEAVRVLLARELGVPRAQVELVRGASGRNKTLAVRGDPAVLLPRAQALGGAEAGAAPSGPLAGPGPSPGAGASGEPFFTNKPPRKTRKGSK